LQLAIFAIVYPMMITTVMFFAQPSVTFSLIATIYHAVYAWGIMPAVTLWRGLKIMPINIRPFRVVFANMFSTRYYLHIFNAIICLIPVYVVYLFSWFKWPTKIFSHKVAMMLNPFSVYCGSHITALCFSRFIPYRQGKTFVTIPAMIMQGTEVFRRSIAPLAVTVRKRTNSNLVRHNLMIQERK